MEYNVIISPYALNEIEEITDFYNSINLLVLIKFIDILDESIQSLSCNPHFYVKYKTYRSLPLKRFPFILIYDIDENCKEVKILSCFHTSRNPNKYPK